MFLAKKKCKKCQKILSDTLALNSGVIVLEIVREVFVALHINDRVVVIYTRHC